MIGERGYTLSGGQRQRIAIARTLLVNPRILMLDDATSAIDAQREFEIHGALRTLMRGRTTLIIAHRLSTISLADRVVVLEGGRIVADGRHDDLMRDVPLYREILAHAEEEYEREHEQEDDEEQEQARRERIAELARGSLAATAPRRRPIRCRISRPGGSTDVGRRRFGGGRMMGPPPGAQGAMWGTAPGTQFAGIPPEMLERVQDLLEQEPDYELQDVPFTQVVDEDEKPFTLGRVALRRSGGRSSACSSSSRSRPSRSSTARASSPTPSTRASTRRRRVRPPTSTIVCAALAGLRRAAGRGHRHRRDPHRVVGPHRRGRALRPARTACSATSSGSRSTTSPTRRRVAS